MSLRFGEISTSLSGTAGQFLKAREDGIGFELSTVDTGITTIGSLDGQTKTVSGAFINDHTLYLQTASGTTYPGLISTGAQVLGGSKTFTSSIVGSITGNAGTVTSGVYTTGDQSIGGTKTFSSTIGGSITGNAVTANSATNAGYATNAGNSSTTSDTSLVRLTGNQTIGGTKTFSSTITANITGNADSANTAVYADTAGSANAANTATNLIGADVSIQPSNIIYFMTNSTNKWTIGTGGNFLPWTDNVVAVGNATYRASLVRARVVTQGFTGGHFYLATSGYTPMVGDALKLINRQIVRCTQEKDPACIGIYSGYYETTSSGQEYVEDSFEINHYREINPVVEKTIYYTIALGDTSRDDITSAKLCNEGGNIIDGDLLCTASGYPGYLKKQDDDLLHSYTVAQAREPITFSGSPTVTGCYIYILK